MKSDKECDSKFMIWFTNVSILRVLSPLN